MTGRKNYEEILPFEIIFVFLQPHEIFTVKRTIHINQS